MPTISFTQTAVNTHKKDTTTFPTGLKPTHMLTILPHMGYSNTELYRGYTCTQQGECPLDIILSSQQ